MKNNIKKKWFGNVSYSVVMLVFSFNLIPSISLASETIMLYIPSASASEPTKTVSCPIGYKVTGLGGTYTPSDGGVLVGENSVKFTNTFVPAYSRFGWTKYSGMSGYAWMFCAKNVNEIIQSSSTCPTGYLAIGGNIYNSKFFCAKTSDPSSVIKYGNWYSNGQWYLPTSTKSCPPGYVVTSLKLPRPITQDYQAASVGQEYFYTNSDWKNIKSVSRWNSLMWNKSTTGNETWFEMYCAKICN